MAQSCWRDPWDWSGRGRVVAVAALLAGVAACEGIDCSVGTAGPTFEIEVVDAATEAPRASGAVGRVFRGAELADSLRATTTGSSARYLRSVYLGDGTYRVRVEHAGYVPWELDNVEVSAGGGPSCGGGVATRRLRAALTPSARG
jgi:hypothetical protein